MRSLLAAAVVSAIAALPLGPASAAVRLGEADENARRLWESGVAAVLRGEKPMADALWRRCLEAEPGNRDCRAGLVLLGHADLLAPQAQEKYVPPQEEVLREGAKARISGREDKANALRNWKLGQEAYQRGDLARARDAWARCAELDLANRDCREGLQRLGGAPAGAGGDSDKLYKAGMRALMAGDKAKAAAAFEACLAADAEREDCAQGLERAGK